MRKVAAITGTSTQWTRKEIHDASIDAGVRFQKHVDADVTTLIAGDNPGSRVDKAHARGIEGVSIAEFMESGRHP